MEQNLDVRDQPGLRVLVLPARSVGFGQKRVARDGTGKAAD